MIRTLLLPLVIIAQRNAARMNNYLPQMQAIQLKLTEARQCGNELDAARYSQELMIFMKEKSVNPLKNMIVPLAQVFIYIFKTYSVYTEQFLLLDAGFHIIFHGFERNGDHTCGKFKNRWTFLVYGFNVT